MKSQLERALVLGLKDGRSLCCDGDAREQDWKEAGID